jgi:hypothetical protein
MIATLPTQEQVDRIAQELAQDVVSIGFRVGRDWSDDPAIYFRVVLSDEASQLDRLAKTAKRVRETLFEKLSLLESTHLPYFSFRSQSEQTKMQDNPAWD